MAQTVAQLIVKSMLKLMKNPCKKIKSSIYCKHSQVHKRSNQMFNAIIVSQGKADNQYINKTRTVTRTVRRAFFAISQSNQDRKCNTHLYFKAYISASEILEAIRYEVELMGLFENPLYEVTLADVKRVMNQFYAKEGSLYAVNRWQLINAVKDNAYSYRMQNQYIERQRDGNFDVPYRKIV